MAATSCVWLAGLLISAFWLLLLLLVVAGPFVSRSTSSGDELVRNTVRLALLYYFAATLLLLVLRPDEWSAESRWSGLARQCWTLAWAAYIVHVCMAFHHYHHWSHAAAMDHTREVSGLGEGIFVSYLFTIVWTADVAWWWLRPKQYLARSPAIGQLLHLFMLFVIFNATIVFETGFIRWAGTILFGSLTVAWLGRRWLRLET
jgi:hypothetical protein